MANSLVVRRDTSLAKRNRALRAAQYVRMSTDYQRYSIQNQAAAIAAFAQQANLTIVRTYVDEGRSGLRIKGRAGLTQLLDDVRSGNADFAHVLVYDVSRWGRFQDIDESAHYEFICKQNGIKVTYCAEQFDNDGSLLSSIIKNIKRVMAAEFSRELSVKTHTGQCLVASLGFRVGGPLTFGLRRELVDEQQRSKGWLTKGQMKSLKTDRVRLALGSEDEVAIIKSIFQQFVTERKSICQIARELNQSGVLNQDGGLWNHHSIRSILKSENYIGNLVHNRGSRRLGQKWVSNPPDLWIRRDGVTEPMVDPSLFAQAQKLLAERRTEVSEDEMLLRLRLLLKRKGKISSSVVNNAPGVPHVTTYIKHFGSLRKALALIGYVSPHDCDWLDTKDHWSVVVRMHARQVAEALQTHLGLHAHLDETGAVVTVTGRGKVFFLVARQAAKPAPHHQTHWRAYRRAGMSGLLVILRLGERNREVADYLLLPAAKLGKSYLRFSSTCMRGAARFDTRLKLIKGIEARMSGRR